MMKSLLLLIALLLCVSFFAFDPFLVQTGGNLLLATDYKANYGNPADLFGIRNSAFGVQMLEYSRAGDPAYDRKLHLTLFDSSEGGIAGILEYSMDVRSEGNLREISYTISAPLGPLTTFGVKLGLAMDDFSDPSDNTYYLLVDGGISGIALYFLDYVVGVRNGLVWTNGDSAFYEKLDLLIGLRLVFDDFRAGFELGTRDGMDVRYGGFSSEITLWRALTLRGGVSVNLDWAWNTDFVIGCGLEYAIGNVRLGAGMGTNLNNTITDHNINIQQMWGFSIQGEW